jgi:hypothetical protein
MSNIDRIPIKTSPRLMEAVVQEMQVQLGAGLMWRIRPRVAVSIRNRLLKG